MRHPIPPFNRETAIEKIRLAEDGWNGRDPQKVTQGYSEGSQWRNRSEFINGRDDIANFLANKWASEREYRLIKELFAFDSNRIAVRYAYEHQNENGDWFRAYGNENWIFDKDGYMTHRHASINDVAITEEQRLFRWPQGRRPDNHPGLSELGL